MNVSDPVIIMNAGTVGTSPGQLFIYPVLQDAQRCSGTVTGVRYCYQRESVNFNLLIFDEPVDYTSTSSSIQYNINQVQVISINNSGSIATCSGSVCCASSTFNTDTRFQLETGIFTYGIEAVKFSILGFSSTTDYSVSSYFGNADLLINSMITIDSSTTTTLRIVQFIVGERIISFNNSMFNFHIQIQISTLRLLSRKQ